MPTLMPIDEARADASLSTARDNLFDALRRNATGALAALISPKLNAGTNLVEGLEWADEDRVSLLKALRFGGAFTTERGAEFGRREFCAPYAYAKYPEVKDREPWFAEVPGVILGDNVAVHDRPTQTSRVIARLRHAIVRSEGTLKGADDRRTEWVLVGLPIDQEGYVLASDIWKPDEYHVCFAKEGNFWLVSKISNEVLLR